MKRDAIKLSEEVAAALAEGQPVVALESSVLVQGLPPPHNREAQRACERAVRAAGAIPALTAVVAGQPCAGLSAQELEQLVAPGADRCKVAVRDLAPAMAFKRWGGTTVSATCAIADAAGIRLFATGGIGGVHRNVERTFDISQDLLAVARSRIAVVTAGAKAILDLPKTLEALEALGVPVIGYQASELPAFYTSSSGLPLEHRVSSAAEAAELLGARWDLLDEGGVLFANAVPREAEADSARIEQAIEESLERAGVEGVRGKALTPFLLAEVARRTGGESLQANLALLTANARVAAEIAVAYASRTGGRLKAR